MYLLADAAKRIRREMPTGRIALLFGSEKFARLQALKDVWDPHNVFRHNQNIPPSRVQAAAPTATDPATPG